MSKGVGRADAEVDILAAGGGCWVFFSFLTSGACAHDAPEEV
jgi:hypothetical protein